MTLASYDNCLLLKEIVAIAASQGCLETHESQKHALAQQKLMQPYCYQWVKDKIIHNEWQHDHRKTAVLVTF